MAARAKAGRWVIVTVELTTVEARQAERDQTLKVLHVSLERRVHLSLRRADGVDRQMRMVANPCRFICLL